MTAPLPPHAERIKLAAALFDAEFESATDLTGVDRSKAAFVRSFALLMHIAQTDGLTEKEIGELSLYSLVGRIDGYFSVDRLPITKQMLATLLTEVEVVSSMLREDLAEPAPKAPGPKLTVIDGGQA
jgi:hypothetical protein